MKTIKQLAREAGAGFECSTLTVNGKDAHDFIERFHELAIAQYREGLLAGVGEPAVTATGKGKPTLHLYTADQMAAAVLREREACTVAAIDAIAFNGGTAQMESHVSAAIRGQR